MSELKVYHCHLLHNEYTEFYSKPEADKVIVELKDKLSHKTEFAIQCQMAAHTLQQKLRHHKYKRCMAMAERCSERFHHYVVLSAFSPNKGAIPFYDKMLHKAYRWKYKWLELAEKFKEAK